MLIKSTINYASTVAESCNRLVPSNMNKAAANLLAVTVIVPEDFMLVPKVTTRLVPSAAKVKYTLSFTCKLVTVALMVIAPVNCATL